MASTGLTRSLLERQGFSDVLPAARSTPPIGSLSLDRATVSHRLTVGRSVETHSIHRGYCRAGPPATQYERKRSMCLPCCFSSLADPDVQPAVQRLGRRLRRPSRRRRDDRPRGPRRRPPHHQRRHLPTPQPRHRHPRHSRLSRTEPVASFSSVASASESSVADIG